MTANHRLGHFIHVAVHCCGLLAWGAHTRNKHCQQPVMCHYGRCQKVKHYLNTRLQCVA